MELIDSHCHLDGFAGENGLREALDRAAGAGVRRCITVGTSPKDWVTYREMHAAHPGVVDYTVGLHPGHVDEDWEDAVSQIAPFFTPPSAPVALGEIGLDHFHLPKDPVAAGDTILRQEEAFRRQLQLARELDGPVIIHSRDAFADTVRLIDESEVDWSRVVFHCFSYGPEEVRQLRERGGRASFTGIVTYRNAASVREALVAQGAGPLMVETDCPYLAPEPHRSRSNEPALLPHIARQCAESLGMEAETLAAQTTATTRAFFGLD